mmetsp:Transcript_31121/g.79897  ORF Transcript_31121/g.79897 Transcript_31121/m.79897 type:complete len:228 (-) Transcript_31121:545-1228(-)
MSAALPKPLSRSTLSVPARIPLSCAPPKSRGGSFTPLLTYKAPTPFGAPILCPTNVAMSTPMSCTSTLTLPRLCAASVCTRMSIPSTLCAISLMGCSAPISLLPCIIVIKHVSGRRAASMSSTLTMPSWDTPTAVKVIFPCRSSERSISEMAGCSMFVVTTCGTSASLLPIALRIAQLSLSVPHDVKYISSGLEAPTAVATRCLARSTASLHFFPYACTLDGFPKAS